MTAAATDELNEAAARLQAGLPALWAGMTVELLDQVDSSNTELLRRARDGDLRPVLLVAKQQTAGRGRLGRTWSTQGPLQALTFSLSVPLRPADWSGLSLAVGVTVAETLHPQVGIKWPNDLWLGERKLAGILIETAAPPGAAAGVASARQAVVGIGINLERPAPEGLRTEPAGLRELWPACSAGQVLERVCAPLVSTLAAFERSGFGPFAQRYATRDVLCGREVALSDGSHGMAQGVAPDGALLVHTAAGVQRVSSSEVSVRPVT